VGVRACKFSSQPPAVKNLLRKKKKRLVSQLGVWYVCMYYMYVCVIANKQFCCKQGKSRAAGKE